jgi:hypothetical protein
MDIYGGREDQTARAFFYSDLCKVIFHIIFLYYSTFLHTEEITYVHAHLLTRVMQAWSL